MRLARNSIISASLLLAASMGGMGLASAQGDDAAQEVFAPEEMPLALRLVFLEDFAAP